MCAEKKLFFVGWLCISWKRWLFLQPKSFSSPSCLAWAEKVRLFRKTKRFLLQKICLSTLKSDAFPQTKRFSFTQAILFCLQTPNVFTNQKLSIWTNLSLLPSKQPFSTLHLPFPPSHNLLFAKNKAILLQSALNPHAVTPEPRTDSKPFRRRLVRKTGVGSCRRKALLKASSIELWIEVAGRSPVCFLVTFCTTQKVTTRFPFGKFEVLRTSNQRTQITPYHEQN